MRFIILLTILVFLISPLTSQEATAGTLQPASWYKISIKWFDIVFPGSLEEDARYIAAMLDTASDAVYETGHDAGNRRRRWQILLSNTHFIPNGYVSSLPRHSHWYELPHASIGSMEWYAMLAVHETRHMAQFDDLNRGVTRALSLLFGDTGGSIGLGSAVPAWYLEGDAVLTESLLSGAGRGRSAGFSREYRAQLLGPWQPDGPVYPQPGFAQAVHGSYRRFLPNHYAFGYHFVNHLRREYGDDIWQALTRRSARLPFPHVSLALAVRRETGKSLDELYEQMLVVLRDIWQDQDRVLMDLAPEIFDFDTRLGIAADYSRYLSFIPVTGSTDIIAQHFSMARASSIVWIDTASGEARSILRDPIPMHPVSFIQSQAEWIERLVHPLNEKRASGDIFTLDLDTGRRQRISRGGRYHFSTISPCGSMIAALHFSKDRRSEIHLWDLEPQSGRQPGWQQNASLELPPGSVGYFISMEDSEEARDEKVFYLTYRDRRGMGIRRFAVGQSPVSWEDGEDVLYSSAAQLGRVSSNGARIFVEADIKGIEGIWECRDNELFLITRGAYGALAPVVQGNTLYFASYASEHGDVIASVDLDRRSGIALSLLPDFSGSYLAVPAQEEQKFLPPFSQEALAAVSGSVFTVKPYSRFAGAFAYHSWIPEMNLDSDRLRFSLLSENLHQDIRFKTSVSYDYELDTWQTGHEMEFQIGFPLLNLMLESSGDVGSVPDSLVAEAGIGLPFRQRRGRLNLSLIPETAVVALLRSGSDPLFGFSHALRAGLSRQQGMRSYQPEMGVFVNGKLLHLSDTILSDNFREAGINIYLPGGLAHSAFQFKLRADLAGDSFIRRRQLLPYGQFHSEPASLHAGVSWDAPFLYPDRNGLNVSYLRRQRLAAYADFGWAGSSIGFDRIRNTLPDQSYRIGFISDISSFHFHQLEISLYVGPGYRVPSGQAFADGSFFYWYAVTARLR